jgi:hypothetical protein
MELMVIRLARKVALARPGSLIFVGFTGDKL